MQIRTLHKNNWQDFFDLVSKMAQGQRVELEIAALDIGDQIESEWSQVEGFSYEPDRNVLFINTTAVEHMVRNPLEIVVIERGAGIEMIGIKDDRDQTQVIRFRAPLMLESRKEKTLGKQTEGLGSER